jgi:hypothetical protein
MKPQDYYLDKIKANNDPFLLYEDFYGTNKEKTTLTEHKYITEELAEKILGYFKDRDVIDLNRMIRKINFFNDAYINKQKKQIKQNNFKEEQNNSFNNLLDKTIEEINYGKPEPEQNSNMKQEKTPKIPM